MYELVYSDTATRQLEKLTSDTQRRILRALERIRIRPEAYVTRLVGQLYYRFRVGDYCVILDVLRQRLLILVIEIGHRKDIYK